MSYPELGDIVVLQHPHEQKMILKRVIRERGRGTWYWVEGDNEVRSIDSRHFGWVPRKTILGKAKVIHKTTP